MRIYYVFDVKDEFVSLYKDNANTLYNILNQMYYMKREDINYGYNLFRQIVNKQDKFKLDKYIFLLMHNKMKYAKKGNDHVINNLYKDEVSILKVKNTHILINSNKSYTEFFNILGLSSLYNILIVDTIKNNIINAFKIPKINPNKTSILVGIIFFKI